MCQLAQSHGGANFLTYYFCTVASSQAIKIPAGATIQQTSPDNGQNGLFIFGISLQVSSGKHSDAIVAADDTPPPPPPALQSTLQSWLAVG